MVSIIDDSEERESCGMAEAPIIPGQSAIRTRSTTPARAHDAHALHPDRPHGDPRERLMQPFELKTPASLEDAIKELPGEHSYAARSPSRAARILTVMKDDIEAPSTLVEIGHLLSTEISETPGGLTLGAGVTIQDIADHEGVRAGFTALAEAAASVASPQIRSQGTLGGNLNQKPRCPYYRHSAVSCSARRQRLPRRVRLQQVLRHPRWWAPISVTRPTSRPRSWRSPPASRSSGREESGRCRRGLLRRPEEALDRETVLKRMRSTITVPRPAAARGRSTTSSRPLLRALRGGRDQPARGGRNDRRGSCGAGGPPRPWHSPRRRPPPSASR